MTSPVLARGAWLPDARDDDSARALRVSWHPEQGCAVVSTWREGRCVGTVRLRRDEVAALITELAQALAAPPDV